MYLHEVADENASFTKEDMQKGKHTGKTTGWYHLPLLTRFKMVWSEFKKTGKPHFEEYERKLMDNFRKQQEELKRKNEEVRTS